MAGLDPAIHAVGFGKGQPLATLVGYRIGNYASYSGVHSPIHSTAASRPLDTSYQ